MRKVLFLSALMLLPWTLAAQNGPLHVLLITGLGGEQAYSQQFHESALAIHDAAVRWGAPDSNRIWLAENPARAPGKIDGRATRESVAAAFATLARRAQPGDVVLVVLIGHGSGVARESKVNLSGPDPEAWEYEQWLRPFLRSTVVFVNASSASGDFLPIVSGPGRIVITSTKSSTERNESIFHIRFAEGLAGGEADADKDGRVSVLEEYSYARAEVRRAYETDNRLLTEHAQIDDNGDGKGSDDPAASESGDGTLARQVAFGGAPASSDPRVIALMAERRALEAEVVDLRTRRAATDSTVYARELERLLLLIAEKTQAIRALERGGPP
jgi:hypothetical protein